MHKNIHTGRSGAAINSCRYVSLMAAILLIFILGPPPALAQCVNDWSQASTQNMMMEEMSASMTDYANNQRHFSYMSEKEFLDIFFLQGVAIVKGLPTDEIEKKRDTFWWLGLTFVVPGSVLSSIAPDGPCTVNGTKSFSTDQSGALRVLQQKIVHVEGTVTRENENIIRYSFVATTDKPSRYGAAIRYKGTMIFSKRQASLIDDVNIKGYTVVPAYGPPPFPVAGSEAQPASTIGELKRNKGLE